MTDVTADSAQGMPGGSDAASPAPAVNAVLEKLVAMHQARVARLAQRLLAWDGDVDDIVQEVFVAAWKNLDRFRGESKPETWLMRITINQCRSRNRREVLRRALLLRVGRERLIEQTPANPTTRDEKVDGVRRAVRELPSRYREVMVLKYLEGLEADEIQKILKLSRSAMDVRLHRGRELLRGQLAKWIES